MVLSDLDRDLLNRCLARTDGAWESFIDRYLALITHVVTSTAEGYLPVFAEETRDDMVAEILLTLVEDDYAVLRRFRGQSSLGTYLVVIARRIAVRRIAKLRSADSNIPRAKLVGVTSEGNGPEPSIENTEEVRALLDRLSDQEARIIRLFHLEHRSYREIGEQLDIPENSVGPLLSRAREAMRTLAEGV